MSTSSDGNRSDLKPSRAWRLGVSGSMIVAILVLDQLSKLAVRSIGASLSFTLIPGIIDVRYVENTGAAFSLGEGHGLMFVALAIAVVAAVAIYILRTPEISKAECAGLAAVCAGALGNAIDRVLFGFVTDFIATTFIDFPVFNVADIAITCGVAVAVLSFVFLAPGAQVDATAELNRRDRERRERRSAKGGKGGSR